MKSRRGIVIAKSTIVDALGSWKLSDSELDEFADALIRPQPSALRFRRDADVQDTPCRTNPIPWYSLARKLHDPTIQPSRFLAYARGDYFLQDAGSLLALAACSADRETVTEPMLICDLCAAPGGKATALLEMLGDRGFLVANEPIRSRVAPLAFNLVRTGSDRYAITSLDPDRFVEHASGMFDLVLVDAPCSGQALLARGQQSESSLSPRQIEHSAARQRRILHAATQLLRSGGLLVYSTCTFATMENEDRIQSLIDQEIVEPSRVDRLESYTSAEACYRLWPHQHHCAGSFAASVRVRQGGSPGVDVKRKRRKPKRRGSLPDEAQQWFEIDDQALCLKFGDAVVYAWPVDVPDWITELAVAGPELIHRTGRTWKPSHASAIRRSGRLKGLRAIDANPEQAKSFLAGQPIPCPANGWHIVRLNGRPLGWIKASQGIGKNHLPAAARMAGPWLD